MNRFEFRFKDLSVIVQGVAAIALTATTTTIIILLAAALWTFSDDLRDTVRTFLI